jgi:hypothetical protein
MVTARHPESMPGCRRRFCKFYGPSNLLSRCVVVFLLQCFSKSNLAIPLSITHSYSLTSIELTDSSSYNERYFFEVFFGLLYGCLAMNF